MTKDEAIDKAKLANQPDAKYPPNYDEFDKRDEEAVRLVNMLEALGVLKFDGS